MKIFPARFFGWNSLWANHVLKGDIVTKYCDLISGVFSLFFAAGLYALTLTIDEVSSIGGVGADFMPNIMAAVIALLGVILCASSLRELALIKKGLLPLPEEDKVPAANGYLLVTANIILFIAYIYFLDILGFIISTAIFLFFQMVILTEKADHNFRQFIIVSLCVPVVSYYLFRLAFQVMLPEGILG